MEDIMLIKFSKTEKFDRKEGTIWDYPISQDIGIAYQVLKSRGPKDGKYLNKECSEIYFVIEGEAKFVLNNIEYKVQKNDVVVVPENTPHFIDTKFLKYITITRPDWYEGQYETVI